MSWPTTLTGTEPVPAADARRLPERSRSGHDYAAALIVCPFFEQPNPPAPPPQSHPSTSVSVSPVPGAFWGVPRPANRSANTCLASAQPTLSVRIENVALGPGSVPQWWLGTAGASDETGRVVGRSVPHPATAAPISRSAATSATVILGTLSAALLTLPRGYHSAMAREGDRRGPSAPRRSPQELAETLATLAASTPEPPPRPRRRDTRANESTPQQVVTLTPEPEVEPQVPEVPAHEPAPAFEAPPPEIDDPPPAVDTPAPASDAPDPEFAAPAPPQPSEIEPGVSTGTPARTRLHSRAGGRIWHRKPRSRSRSALRIGGWRRSRRPRSRSDRARQGSRNVRRLYPPLLVLLLIVLVVALVDRGGGSSSKSSAQTTSAAQSVFPDPSTVPTPTPPPAAAPIPPAAVPTPTGKQHPSATQPKACRPLHFSGAAVSVSILQGHVTCRSARAVVRALKSGKGRHRGGPGNRYLSVRGWRCLPSGTCTRAGKSITAS